MEKLMHLNSGVIVNIDSEKPYVIIGRDPSNDVVLAGDIVSRFHATIIRDGADRYLLDHSLNGTFYPVDWQGPIDESSALDSSLRTDELAEKLKQDTGNNVAISHIEVMDEIYGENVGTLAGFVAHRFSNYDSVSPLIDMLNNDDDRSLLCQMGKQLHTEGIIAFTEFARFLYLHDPNN